METGIAFASAQGSTWMMKEKPSAGMGSFPIWQSRLLYGNNAGPERVMGLRLKTLSPHGEFDPMALDLQQHGHAPLSSLHIVHRRHEKAKYAGER